MKSILSFVAILAFAVVIRLEYLREISREPQFLEPILDSAMNLEWAREWNRGEWPGKTPYFRAPGAIWGIALGLRLTGDDPVALVRGQILVGAVVPLLVALLATELFGRPGGVVAGVGAALYPMFMFHDGQLLDSFLQVPAFTAAVWLSVRALRKSTLKRIAAASLLWGLVGIVRPPLLLGAGVFTLACVGRSWDVRRGFAAGALCLTLPLFVTLDNVRRGDLVFVASQGGLNFYLGNGAGADGVSATFRDDPRAIGEAMMVSADRLAAQKEGRPLRSSEVSTHYVRRTFHDIRSAPGEWMRLMAKKAVLFWTDREIPNNHDPNLFAEFLPLLRYAPGWSLWAALGLAAVIAFPKSREVKWTAAFLWAVFLSSVFFFVAARFRLVAGPLLISLGGGGLVWSFARLREAGGWSWRGGSYFVLAAALGLLLQMNPYRIPRDPWVLSYVMVAEAERNRGEPVRALSWIERALQREPGLYAARRAQIDLLRGQGRVPEARHVAEQLLREGGERDLALLADYAALLDLSGEPERALAAIDEVLAQDPGNAVAIVHRAIIWAGLGRKEEAREALQRFLERNPSSSQASRARSILSALDAKQAASN